MRAAPTLPSLPASCDVTPPAQVMAVASFPSPTRRKCTGKSPKTPGVRENRGEGKICHGEGRGPWRGLGDRRGHGDVLSAF